jgi:hypothetical protein
MTRTTPFLRITLQLRQIFLTEASTFIAASPSFALIGAHWPAAIPCAALTLPYPTHDTTAARQVIKRHFSCYLVTRRYADIVHLHTSGYVSEINVAIFQFYRESGIGKIVNNLTLHLGYVFV